MAAILSRGETSQFTKRMDVLSQDLTKTQTHEIMSSFAYIPLESGTQLGSSVVETSAKFQSDWMI